MGDLEPGVYPLQPSQKDWFVNEHTKVKAKRTGFQAVPYFSGSSFMFQGATKDAVIADCLEVAHVSRQSDALSAYEKVQNDPAALGMAEHFIILHSALWPLVVLTLIASIGSATFLYEKMRAPLARFVACYDAITQGEVPEKVTLRAVDYLTAEAEALNAMISALGDRSAAREKAVVRFQGLIDELAEQRVDEATILALKAVLGELSGSR